MKYIDCHTHTQFSMDSDADINAMIERRSIRKFKPDMPAKEDIEQIIEAGLYAANGMGKQATITIAVTNKELRNKLSESLCS